ncbi:MAG: S8 family serine peptidase [Flavobacteriales bacterium]|nr:S8 family serine peptidase [Flavobacteriales bacterium]
MRNTFSFLLSIFMLNSLLPAQSIRSAKGTAGKLEGEARQTWYLQDVKSVKAYGVQSDKTIAELIGGMQPKKKVVVAVIDTGVDFEHEDLKDHLWVNADEVPNNGKDDDGNGFVDDINGWNFLVDDSGEDVVYANLEATRILRLSQSLQEKGEAYPAWLTKEVLESAASIFNENTDNLNGYYQIVGVYRKVDSAVVSILKDTAYGFEDVKTIESQDPMVLDAKRIFEVFEKLEIGKSDLRELDQMVTKYTDYWLNLEYQPRAEINFTTENYGNNHVGGKHTGHGTHIAGIIAADASNDLGGRGIASEEAEIMILKVVPDGDENDIDVAHAIRYAVDNGAKIINMSFGKGLSPAKEQVYSALSYAASKNVLIIHAAGNDADDSDEVGNFPNDDGLDENAQQSYLCIGAIGPRKNKRMLASFSNYGAETVDLFAPGEDIYSTLPGNKYGFLSGTSMAAPVVSGVAALIWAYHPELTAVEIRDIILEGALDLSKKKVILPGTRKDKVPFGTLSTSGKVINAYDAYNLAEKKG